MSRFLPIAGRGTGSYYFDSIFSYLSRYVSLADYAVANLETTLRGEAETRNSYACTLAITGEGLEQIRRYLQSDENFYAEIRKAATV